MRYDHRKSIRYTDPLRRQRRRRFLIRTLGATILALLLISGLGYLFLYSGIFGISDIQAQGTASVTREALIKTAQDYLGTSNSSFWMFPTHLVVFSVGGLRSHLLAQFPQLSEVTVDREGLNRITITASDRSPLGSWCFLKGGERCFFFDEQGTLWGQALRSSGTLLLSIEDERTEYSSPPAVSKDYLKFVITVSDALRILGVGVRTIQILDSRLGDVLILTSGGYRLLMNFDHPTENQLSVFRIFYGENIKGKGVAFSSVDLTVPGRVYVK